MENNAVRPAAEATSNSSVALVLAWLFVSVPLIWGVSQTFVKALTLFQ